MGPLESNFSNESDFVCSFYVRHVEDTFAVVRSRNETFKMFDLINIFRHNYKNCKGMSKDMEYSSRNLGPWFMHEVPAHDLFKERTLTVKVEYCKDVYHLLS